MANGEFVVADAHNHALRVVTRWRAMGRRLCRRAGRRCALPLPLGPGAGRGRERAGGRLWEPRGAAGDDGGGGEHGGGQRGRPGSPTGRTRRRASILPRTCRPASQPADLYVLYVLYVLYTLYVLGKMGLRGTGLRSKVYS